MSTDQTTNLGLPFLMPAQAQKHVTVNESLTRLDALVQLVVESRSLDVQPGAPADGALWITPAGKTGPEWDGYANWGLAYYRDGAWEPISPKAGWLAWVKDEAAALRYDGAAWSLVWNSVPSLNGGPLAGLRNALINGAFDVWQRGDGDVLTSAGAYVGADRWLSHSGTGGEATISRQAFSPGEGVVDGGAAAASFLRHQQTADYGGSGAYPYLSQSIEDVRSFAGQTVTLSFDARGDGPVTLSPRLFQNFGSGGSSNVNLAAQTVDISTEWTRYACTYSIPSISGKTVGEGSHVSAQFLFPISGAPTIDIARVQLEIGAVATPFERRPIALEETLCRRYFERITTGGAYGDVAGGVVINATSCEGLITYQPKRGAPTITETGDWRVRVGGGSASASVAFANIGRDRARISITSSGLTSGHAFSLQSDNDAEACIDITAEL